MEITFLGHVAILLTILFLVLRRHDMFLYAAVFFSGFSGASVLNIAGGSIQPSFFFFLIFFLLSFRNHLFLRLDKRLILFYAYCLISITFPFFFEHTGIKIISQDAQLVPLHFSVSNIIQIAYLTFDLIFLNTLLCYKNDNKIGTGTFTAYRYGFYAVILICLYQLLAFRFDLPFDILFRKGVHGNIQGTRLYGPCDEASMLCYYLVPSILFCLQTKRSIPCICFSFLAVLIGVLTESSTFLVGMSILLILAIPTCVHFLSCPHTVRTWRATFIGLFCVIILLILMSGRLSKLVELLISKLTRHHDSGIQRSQVMLISLQAGLLSPIGVGFGCARSTDLFSTWFCNIGIIGITLFAVYILHYVKAAHKRGCLSKTLPYLVTLILMLISVSEPYNLFIWFLLSYEAFAVKIPSTQTAVAVKVKQVAV